MGCSDPPPHLSELTSLRPTVYVRSDQLHMCPECRVPLIRASACVSCPQCGWSRCD
jgi:hypothetical protein